MINANSIYCTSYALDNHKLYAGSEKNIKFNSINNIKFWEELMGYFT
jgi:hypothetical protein